MAQVPANLKYVSSHEWIRDEGDGVVTVGVTDFAQEQLGDVVFVELPEEGVEINKEDAIAVVESVKAASDIYAPVSGEVIAVNEGLADEPEKVNEEPYDGAWFFKVKLSEPSEMDALLSAEQYEAECQ
ncbi:glycine cleavage system protein GcvH [Bermanella marisrubri]|uniref:Glycine cleavage system H protein n=1 Tax=Bermanella marisrubri TaxID=207949 RepID=Q1N2R8_9GAMM|nr:glycine cleavage system protein GcvH [Bermanella marisrubri]EAT12601.1 glycine cleavage system protein H [Oceanobacter sp. RED65] [Bermanella marisrubri]QIZ84846.1 glycine cleavage system protein GcvH [Bermanella marisrubri]